PDACNFTYGSVDLAWNSVPYVEESSRGRLSRIGIGYPSVTTERLLSILLQFRHAKRVFTICMRSWSLTSKKQAAKIALKPSSSKSDSQISRGPQWNGPASR